MKKGLILAAIVLIVTMLAAGCDLLGGNNDNKPGTGGEVDFTSYNTNHSILVRNNTSERLVAFKGDIRQDMLIGGIPAHAVNHALQNNPSLFDKTEAFPMILITEAQYNANKNNLSSPALKNAPFTRVFVFYNKNGDNNVVYELDTGLGGINKFIIVNPSTSINIELRRGGINGETFGFAPAGFLETTLRVQDGDFTVFPVFVRYNPFRDIVERIIPKRTIDGAPWFVTFSLGDFGHPVGEIREFSLNMRTLLSSVNFSLSTGSALIVIDNQTSPPTGVRFLEGSTVRRTLTGMEFAPSGVPLTFQIQMPTVGNNFAQSRVISNMAFGPTSDEKPLQTGENDSTVLNSLTVECDKMYTITVSGNHNNGTLKAWVSNIIDIDTSDFNITSK